MSFWFVILAAVALVLSAFAVGSRGYFSKRIPSEPGSPFRGPQPAELSARPRFRRPVVPGDRLDLHVEVIQRRTSIWKLRGEAHVDGARCAEGELLASIIDRDKALG